MVSKHKRRDEKSELTPPPHAKPIPRELSVDPEVTILADALAEDEDPLLRKVSADPTHSPALSGGDLDAAWDVGESGEETVGGSAPTPDQDNVDEIGEAVGLEYQDEEPLEIEEKLEKRDTQRWELDPASSEDYVERVRELSPVNAKKRQKSARGT